MALADVTYNAGDTIRVRFSATGNGTTTLAAKAWKVGSAEPAAAQATVTGHTASLQTAGSFAIVSYLASNATNAPVTVSVDNLLITAPVRRIVSGVVSCLVPPWVHAWGQP